jgi:hypothetical protein
VKHIRHGDDASRAASGSIDQPKVMDLAEDELLADVLNRSVPVDVLRLINSNEINIESCPSKILKVQFQCNNMFIIPHCRQLGAMMKSRNF